jgi:hypothetical protein
MEVRFLPFKTLMPEADNSKFWKPEEEGEWIQGKVQEYILDGFGNHQILLDRGIDEDTGEKIETVLPSHKNLRRYYSQIQIGDIIKVTVKKIIPPKNEGYYPFFIYDVGILPSEEDGD